MQVFSESTVLLLLGALSNALFAGAASARAKKNGAHFTGALVLGWVCGVTSQLCRALIFYGSLAAVPQLENIPGYALTGAIAGIGALYLAPLLPIVFWLQALAISLGTSLAAIEYFPLFGIVSALTLAVLTAILPGFIADMAMGDLAAFVERDWYVMAAFIGAVFAVFIIFIVVFMLETTFLKERIAEIAILAGTFLAFTLQLIKKGEKF